MASGTDGTREQIRRAELAPPGGRRLRGSIAARLAAAALGVIVALCWSTADALASDLVLPASAQAEPVSIEFAGADAVFVNQLVLDSPTQDSFGRAEPLIPPPVQGNPPSQPLCTGTASGPPAVPGCLFHTLESRRGSRVELGPLAGGTTLEFTMYATTGDGQQFAWSSDPTQNSDGADHVHTTELYPSDASISGVHVYEMAWEDEPFPGSDGDFNDLIAIVRVGGDMTDGPFLAGHPIGHGGDTDGDGLFDDWERHGINVNPEFDNDTTDPGEADILSAGGGDLTGADPTKKDVFVELGYMSGRQPDATVLQKVGDAFTAAGIQLHLRLGAQIPDSQILNFAGDAAGCTSGLTINPPATTPTDFDDVKAAFFPAAHRFAYHYGLIVRDEDGASSDQHASGCAEIQGNDFYVSLGDPCTQGPPTCFLSTTDVAGNDMRMAGALMHELGHNFGLLHGGGDNVERKPNYLSVMNYSFQLQGLRHNPPSPDPCAQQFTASCYRVDYSHGTTGIPGTLTEGSLDENRLWPGDTRGRRYCSPTVSYWVNAGAPTDWNCDLALSPTPVAFDINQDSAQGTLNDHNDWATVAAGLEFQDGGSFQDGSHPDGQLSQGEITLEKARTAGLLTQPPDVQPIPAQTYTLNRAISPLTVTAGDPDSSCSDVTLSASGLPPGLTFQDNHDCTGTLSGTPTAVGSFKAIVAAVDETPQGSQAVADIHVEYAFNGLLQPIDDPPVFNTVKAGSAIPVKFQLSGDQGLAIFAAGSPSSAPTACDGSAPTAPVDEVTTDSKSGLSYDAVADQYVYVWKTDRAWSGTCRRLSIELADGTTHTALFQFE